MSVGHKQLRNTFKTFWEKRGHKEVPPIPLVPKDDPTTLFTGSGMQQFVPNLLGAPHPQGTRLYNIQRCIRAQDIEEVGDNSHDTFFEMMGNWSLGDYFKEEQLSWFYEFLTKELRLPKERLHITVFEGEDGLPKDEESAQIWKKLGVPQERIYFYPAEKNWWSRAGVPQNMPAGEPGGPDSEVFYEFDVPHNTDFGPQCHPNCDCGRYLEIGNSVFMQYIKQKDGSFTELPKKNVDFGGGLERLLAAANNSSDIFTTDLFSGTIEEIEKQTGKSYKEEKNKPEIRVIADHLRSSVFLITDGVRPSNKEQGYILRRLLRRCAIKMHQLGGGLTPDFSTIVDRGVLQTYDGVQGIDRNSQRETAFSVINQEVDQFRKSLDRGLKAIQKVDKIDGKIAFDIYQSYGFPLEITEELFIQKGQKINKKQFHEEFEKHKNVSRAGATKKFKGGLADHGEQTVRYHTATHLLHQALFDVLGNDVRQEGSNITADRLRFDFSSPKKPSDEDIREVEKIINDKVNDRLPVAYKIIPKDEAFEIGAKSFFKEKYPDMVKVYLIGDQEDYKKAYSKEFCGGPHVENTKNVGKISVYKLEKIGSNLYRIYAK